MSVIPQSHADLLSVVTVANVATVGPKGEPQVNPVWFEWDGDTVNFSQTTTRQKYRNLQRDPNVSFSIMDPANPYRYLEIRGRVQVIEDDPDDEFINRQAKRYLDEDVYSGAQPGDQRVVVKVVPEHTTSMG